jgi:3-oxoadipate enol-lactonase
MSGAVSRGLLDITGASLFYESLGAGPALVLIHGYALDMRMWDDQVEEFARRFRVVRYDLRGFGQSSLPTEEPFSYHEDLEALLDSLGIKKAYILGLSLGGAIAVDFALAYPERTAALIPVDTSALGGYPWPPELDRWFEPITSAGQSGDLDLAKRHWLNTGWFTAARRNRDVAGRLERIVADYSGWHFAHDNPVRALAPPANDRLEAIKAPTLVITGELDVPFYNLPIGETLARRIPYARQVIIPNVGHMCNMEDPISFNRAVISFLAELGSGE